MDRRVEVTLTRIHKYSCIARISQKINVCISIFSPKSKSGNWLTGHSIEQVQGQGVSTVHPRLILIENYQHMMTMLL